MAYTFAPILTSLKKVYMKKVFAILAVAATFAACNNAAEKTEAAVDSTVAVVDSTVSAVADSASNAVDAAAVKVDSTVKAVVDSIKK
jgi:hypothetical protein